MSNVRFLINNIADDGLVTLLRGEPVNSLPLSYMQFQGKQFSFSRRARILGDNIAFRIELASIAYVSGVVLNNHSLSNTAKILVIRRDQQLNEIDRVEVDAFKAKPLGEINPFIDRLVSSQQDGQASRYSEINMTSKSCRYIDLEINDVDSGNQYIDIGRLFIGTTLSPRFNFNWGHGIGFNTDLPRVRRTLSFTMSWLEDREFALFYDALSKLGTEKDFWLSLYPEKGDSIQSRHALACSFNTLPELIRTHFNNWEIPIQVTEV